MSATLDIVLDAERTIRVEIPTKDALEEWKGAHAAVSKLYNVKGSLPEHRKLKWTLHTKGEPDVVNSSYFWELPHTLALITHPDAGFVHNV